MKAVQVRTVTISLATPTLVQAALDKLRTGQALTAGDSGTIAFDPIVNVELIGQPTVVWDGIYYTVFLFVTSG